MPLVPSALFLWVTNFADRLFLVKLADTTEVGLYSVGVRIASAMVLLLTAFRTGVARIRVLDRATTTKRRRAYGFVLTYLVVITTWVAAALALLSPWIVRLARPAPTFDERVARRRPARVLDGRLRRLHRRLDRRRPRAADAVQLGRHRRRGVVNVALNLLLIPPYGMMGAAIATIAAYAIDVRRDGVVGRSASTRSPYQWRRVVTAAAAGVALVAVGKLAGGGLPVSVVLALAYPLALLPLGFYLPSERRAIGARLRLAR